jgi:hypothetical protein
MAGAAFALVLGLSGCGLNEQTTVADAEIERFHRLWNADEFKAVYDDAHMNFRNSQTDEEAVATLERLKRSHGQFKSAKRRSATLSSDQSAPDLTLNYDSVYDQGAAVEVFVYRITGQQALLVSYDIMSPEAAKKRGVDKEAGHEAERKSMQEKLKADAEARKPNG